MKQAIEEVDRRRKIQIKYNEDHHITPQSISKNIRPRLIDANVKNVVITPLLEIDSTSLTPNQRKAHISKLKKEMRSYAIDMDFESAIKLRDKIKEIQQL
jgi:excinuclease ABC subunit B